jgi:hypothetical protein
MLLAHTSREQRLEQVVALHTVEERVDHAAERAVTASPLVQRRMLAHRPPAESRFV